MSRRQLSLATGINENMLSALWHDNAKRFGRDDLDKICQVLKCTPGDLLTWVPNKETTINHN